jgi:hypothetical protein
LGRKVARGELVARMGKRKRIWMLPNLKGKKIRVRGKQSRR